LLLGGGAVPFFSLPLDTLRSLPLPADIIFVRVFIVLARVLAV
jgi:hypothetical protein